MWDYMINILNKITAKNDYLLRCEKSEDIEKGVNTGKGQIIESKFRNMKDYILIYVWNNQRMVFLLNVTTKIQCPGVKIEEDFSSFNVYFGNLC